MSLLDMRTVVLGYAISNAICAIVIALLWQQNRSRFAGLGFWLADYIFQFIGISLIALRGAIPDFLSIVISNSLLIVGTLLMFIGLERFAGKTGPQIHNYLLVAVFTIIQIYFTVVSPNLMARDVNIALGHLIICLQCLWLVTRRAEPNVRTYTHQLGYALAALCLVSVGYGSVNLIAPPGNNFFQSGLVLTLTVMSFQMAYIGLTFGLILLVNRRILMESIIDITERKRAETALRKSEEGIRTLFENTPIGMFQSTPEGKVIYVNPAFAAIMGYASAQEITEAVNRSSVAETIYADPTLRPLLVKEVEQAEGSWKTYENRYRRKDGKIIDAILSFSEHQDPVLGKPTLNGFVQDITERKRAERALHDLSARYEAILDTVPDIIAEVDKNKVYTWVNQAGRQFFGEGVIGQEAASYFEGAQDVYNKVQPLFNGQGDVFYVESWQRRQDGENRLLAWWCRSIIDADGKVTGALSTARDITERRLAEAAVREAEEKYRNIFESTLIGIFRTSPEGRYILVNPAYARILGYDSPESVMQSVNDIGGQIYLDPNERTRLMEVLERQDEIKSYETCIRRKDGRVVAIRVDDSVVRGPDGRALYYQGTILDIDEGKRAEEALRASEDKFSKAFRQSPDLLVISRLKDGLILEINDSWERILGYTREDLIGRSSLDLGIFVSPEQRQKAIDIMSKAGFIRDFEIAVYDKSGKVHQTELSGEQIQITGESCILTIIHDITTRKRAETDLSQRAEELQRLMDTAPIAILMALDPKCQEVIGNQAANQLYSVKEGDNISALFPEQERLAGRRFFQNGRELRPEELPIQRATALGEEVQNAEVEVRLPDGKMMTLLGAASPLFDAEMKVRGAVAAFMDITERKRAEERLRSTLEEKETLLREVHHRVKNNLQAIVYLIEMQSAHLSDEASVQFLKELEEQARTMSLVYEQVYQSDNLARIGMARYLEKLAENVLIAFGRGRTVQLNLDVAQIDLNVEQAMPCGLIVNELITNSLKYAFQAETQNLPAIHISLQPAGESYRLIVGDNGSGIPAELDWQTSRSLGLRLVRLWATHQLGGTIETTGENGTNFEIIFLKSGT